MHEHPPIWQDCTAADVDMDRAAKRQGMAAHCEANVAELLFGVRRRQSPLSHVKPLFNAALQSV
jgi:hypothetical protein